MAAQWTEEEAERVYRELAKRSMTDPEFRTLALSNPTAAVAKINPTPLPPISRFASWRTKVSRKL
jgi:hypothetical protein